MAFARQDTTALGCFQLNPEKQTLLSAVLAFQIQDFFSARVKWGAATTRTGWFWLLHRSYDGDSQATFGLGVSRGTAQNGNVPWLQQQASVWLLEHCCRQRGWRRKTHVSGICLLQLCLELVLLQESRQSGQTEESF